MIRTRLIGAAALAALMTPAAAPAHGEAGEHVETYWQHLDTYENGVARLEKRLARITGDGVVTNKEVDAFVDAWEDVKVHAAIETRATPLYPAIWQGIYALRDAAKADDTRPATVRRHAEATANALREGLGAVKYRAKTRGGEKVADKHDESGETGVAGTFHRIEEQLHKAVEAYEQGDAEKARGLIQDAYFNNFESVEGGLIEQDPELVTRLEQAFNAGLPGLISDGAAAERVHERLEEMETALHRAEKLLKQADKGDKEVF